MCGFGYDAEHSDEDGATGDEESAEDHPWREDVAQKESSKERVPEEGDCTKRREDDDWEGCDLEEGAKEVGGDEYRCKG